MMIMIMSNSHTTYIYIYIYICRGALATSCGTLLIRHQAAMNITERTPGALEQAQTNIYARKKQSYNI